MKKLTTLLSATVMLCAITLIGCTNLNNTSTNENQKRTFLIPVPSIDDFDILNGGKDNPNDIIRGLTFREFDPYNSMEETIYEISESGTYLRKNIEKKQSGNKEILFSSGKYKIDANYIYVQQTKTAYAKTSDESEQPQLLTLNEISKAFLADDIKSYEDGKQSYWGHFLNLTKGNKEEAYRLIYQSVYWNYAQYFMFHKYKYSIEQEGNLKLNEICPEVSSLPNYFLTLILYFQFQDIFVNKYKINDEGNWTDNKIPLLDKDNKPQYATWSKTGSENNQKITIRLKGVDYTESVKIHPSHNKTYIKVPK